MVIVTLSLAAAQGPLVVSVNVTVPADISAALGVYTAFNVVLFGLSVPVPPLHVPPVAPPPTAPASVIELPAHIVESGPAVTVAAGLIVITTSSVNVEHGPLVVNVRVTVPAVTSAALGV